MEKPTASTEPQGLRPVLGRESVQVPDDQDFQSFRSECEAEVGWNLTYSKAGVSVWVQAVEMDRTLHKIKVRLLYDLQLPLHPSCFSGSLLVLPPSHKHLWCTWPQKSPAGGRTVCWAKPLSTDGPVKSWRRI